MNVVVLLACRGKKKPRRDLKPSELGRPFVGGRGGGVLAWKKQVKKAETVKGLHTGHK